MLVASRCRRRNDVREGGEALITLLGVPWDASSSFERGAAEAPPCIRAALASPSSNSYNEGGDDVSSPALVTDGGDLALPPDPAAARQAIETGVRRVVDSGSKPLVLGGDHSITYPILRAFRDRGPLAILHFDSHGDLYDHYEGDRYSHACPFARVMEEGLATRLIQVGLRTLTPHQREQSKKFGTEIFAADRWRAAVPVVSAVTGAVYVSLDLDVLEPMLAPGIAHPEPGGLSIRDVLEVLFAVRADVIGADIVEYNPRFDIRDLTGRVAAKFVKELVGVMQRTANGEQR